MLEHPELVAIGALASTHQRALEIVPLEILKAYSVDVPTDAAALDE
jgi:uncharacterized protein with FMN-binding domain